MSSHMSSRGEPSSQERDRAVRFSNSRPASPSSAPGFPPGGTWEPSPVKSEDWHGWDIDEPVFVRMRVRFTEMLCVTGLLILGTILSAYAGVIQPSEKSTLYNVMLLEADLKTPEQCDKSKWASNQATEISAYGFWFCKGSVLGRLVDEHFFANIQKADLVHYVTKAGARCRENNVEPPRGHDVYIYLGNSSNNKVNIINEEDERAMASEFVQTAISVLEMEAYTSCAPGSPELNLTKWGWETLSGVDF